MPDAGRCTVVYKGIEHQVDRIESYPADAGLRAFGNPAGLGQPGQLLGVGPAGAQLPGA